MTMKTAHIKTVDGTTTLVHVQNEEEYRNWIKAIENKESGLISWVENNEFCYLYKQHVISIRIREEKD